MKKVNSNDPEYWKSVINRKVSFHVWGRTYENVKFEESAINLQVLNLYDNKDSYLGFLPKDRVSAIKNLKFHNQIKNYKLWI